MLNLNGVSWIVAFFQVTAFVIGFGRINLELRRGKLYSLGKDAVILRPAQRKILSLIAGRVHQHEARPGQEVAFAGGDQHGIKEPDFEVVGIGFRAAGLKMNIAIEIR